MEKKLITTKRISEEQRILRLSIFLTIFIAGSGIVMGIFTGSSAIIFDGMYSALDGFFSIGALVITKLLQMDADRHARKPQFTERFQYGFWHLEPLLLLLNGSCLTIAVMYGFFDAASSLFRGGHIPSFGLGVVYAFITAVGCYGLALYEHRKNIKIRSAFIAIDVRGWIISGSISLAVFIAFISAYIIEETSFAWFIPYIDSIVLLIICLMMAGMPLKIVWRALQDVFMITPTALDDRITTIVDHIVEDYNFSDSQTYVARVGRSIMIEIHLILPAGYPIKTVEFLDKIRSEIGDAIGDAGPDRWLTVSFTGKEEWAL